MIDLHCHVLPGIDDGPPDLYGSLELARAAAAAGTRTIVATPHVSSRYPNDAATIARLVDELNRQLLAEGVAVEVRRGAEVALATALELDDHSLAQLVLGDGPWLLVEPPFTPGASGVETLLMDILARGHRIVIAHPERCPAFHRDRAALESIVRAGVLTSVTAGSLVGRFGGHVQRFARALVRDGLAHNVASDAHDHLQRPPGIATELRRARLQPLAAWLTTEVPAAVLAGRQIPPAPAGASAETRALRWRRR